MVTDFPKLATIFTKSEKNKPYFENALLRYLLLFGYQMDKNKSFGGIVAFDSRSVVAGGRVDFFEGAFVAGNTNQREGFDRPQGEHFVIAGVRCHAAVAATVNQSVWVPGFAVEQDLNTQWTFRVNGVTRYSDLPGTLFTRAVENPFSGYYKFPFPVIWGGQENVNFNFRYFNTPAANSNVRVELIGLGLTS